MYNQSFWVGNKFLGSRPLPLLHRDVDGQIYAVRNQAFCCPVCGEVWGRVTVDSPKATWSFSLRPCRNCFHGSWSEVVRGCFSDPPHWGGGPLTFSDDWPPDAIRWEFHSLISNLKGTAL